MKNPKGLIVTILLIVLPVAWLIFRFNTLKESDNVSGDYSEKTQELNNEVDEQFEIAESNSVFKSGDITSGEYISSRYGNPISKPIEGSKVKDESVIIYEEPSEESNPIGSIKREVSFLSQDYDTGWTQIKFDNTTGWIKTENVVKPNEGNSDALQSAIGKTGRVITDILNVRPQPSTVGDPIDQLSFDDTFKVLDDDGTNTWYQIQYGTQSGWIKANTQWIQIDYNS